MTKIRLLSDLHFEFHKDAGESFVESLDASGCDVLVVAGDLCDEKTGIAKSISKLCKKFKRVLYVTGNHELYGSNRNSLVASLRESVRSNPNLTWLQNERAVIDGKRFLGTTLWFPPTGPAKSQSDYWSDFLHIEDFSSWVYKENAKALEFLRRELAEGDIVITHYLPTYLSVHPKYADASTNCFFVCPLDELIAERKPAVWLHGHAHESVDARLGQTRIACNPFGYAGFQLNLKFDENFTIEV